MARVSLIFGTRPEAIKLCPLVQALRASGRFEPHVCVTGQHRELLDQVLAAFGVQPDVDLALMRPDQSLAELTARAVATCDAYLAEARPALLLVQGDTTTAFAAALAAFYRRIPVGHVEAGLRTGDKHAPFPEEINRVFTTRLADWHFAPTPQARDNLRAEGVAAARIHLTGNTGIDALLVAVARARRERPAIAGLPPELVAGDRPLVLITGHRRENFGAGLASVCRAVVELARRHPHAAFVYPVHPNPQVAPAVRQTLAGPPNVFLLPPQSYLAFVALLDRACLVMTDSGGVQEEAPTLGKPVLVTRRATERPEAVAQGLAQLVGTDRQAIIAAAERILRDARVPRRACPSVSLSAARLYGDGRACQRIVAALAAASFVQRAA